MLTIISPKLVITNGLEKAGLLGKVSPVNGTSFNLNKESFKYTYDSVGRSLEIDKLDLGLLFQEQELDLTNSSFNTRLIQPSHIEDHSKLEYEPSIIPTDIFSEVFLLFCRNYGLTGLGLGEVSMGVIDDVYTITVEESIFYKGSITVKYTKPLGEEEDA